MNKNQKSNVEMRRKDRQLSDPTAILQVVDACKVAHVGMIDDGNPYVVALNFGYSAKGKKLELYFHTAQDGRMLRALRKNPNVFFQMHTIDQLRRGTKENPCRYSWLFDSVTGSGTVKFITEPEEKTVLLNKIIHHLDEDAPGELHFPTPMMEKITIFKIVSEDYTGKRRIDD